jgi:two-component system response regulator YesN
MDLDLIFRQDPRIARAMLMVLRDLRVRHSRENAARVASLESTYFSRRFKDVVGVTFALWNASVRVDTARHLLRTTNRQVRDIANAVGYDSVTTFERAFRKMTGVCPTDDRAANSLRITRNAEENTQNADSALTRIL